MKTARIAVRITAFTAGNTTDRSIWRCRVCDFNRKNIAAVNADRIKANTWRDNPASYDLAYPHNHAQ